MTLLYGRRVEVEIADLVIRNLKVHFDIERQPDQTPPTGEIAVYNLSRENEDRIKERGKKVRLDAGYEATIATIFDGQVARVVVEKQGVDRITRVEIGGVATGSANQPSQVGGITTRSYAAGTTIRSVIQDLAEDIDMPLGPLDAIPEDAMLEDGWNWFGPSYGGMKSVLRRVSVNVYEDDGVIRFGVRPKNGGMGKPQADAITINLSPESGLVGRPSLTDEGAEAVSFLMPRARIGGIVNMTSESVNGEWRIAGVRHTGDNWHGSFLTAYDLREM